ncbi:DUF309 domain-containing protein [Desulfocicer niacini]
MKFDPFENRLCRDVRNHLGHCLIQGITNKEITPFDNGARAYLSNETQDHIKAYISHRRQGLKKVLARMEMLRAGSRDYWCIAMILWNLELFFEFHEWLEQKWLTASGDHKKAIQALILSAVVYEQLTYGRTGPAKKTALKAVSLLNQYAHLIANQLDTNLLIPPLRILDPVAPKFSLPDQFLP